ncbi:MAG: T9SS type A sorting domain-containing protein, partial [Bacteroidota bacterium]
VDPAGNYSSTIVVNAFSQSMVVTVCAFYCDGTTECQTLPIQFGAVTTFTFNGSGGGSATDTDGDGFDNILDCNDFDSSIYPGAVELCDGADNNCDGSIDEGCGGGGCTVDIVLVPDSLVNSPYVVYIYMSNANPGAAYIWSLGDGNTIATPYPTWVYDSTGTYTVCCTVAFPDGCTATDCVTFTMNPDGSLSPGGIQMQGFTLNVVDQMPIFNEVEEVAESKIYPNPFNDQLIFEQTGNWNSFQIVNAQGQIIQEGKNSGSSRIELQTTAWSSGVYFLKVSSENGIECRKLLKY